MSLTETVTNLFIQPRGMFTFYQNFILPYMFHTVRVPVMGLLMRGAVKKEMWEKMRSIAPSIHAIVERQRPFEELQLHEENTTNDVISATYAWTRRDVDSITLPTRGTLLTLSGTAGLGRSSVTNFLKTGFLRGYGRFVYYLPMSQRDQVILRAEGGYVAVDDARVVPNEFLFRTGGVGTVRGYAFQSLGSKVGTATTLSYQTGLDGNPVVPFLNRAS